MKIIKLSILLGIFLASVGTAVNAQEISSGIAQSLNIQEDGVRGGSIISSTQQGYVRSRVAYDPSLYGVVVDIPAVAFEQASRPDKLYSIITLGKVYVLVSSINGNISVNDFITSSTIPGVGQKADANGFIIGSALESYSSNDKGNSGLILVSLNPRFGTIAPGKQANLIANIRAASMSPFLSPLTSMRYLLAVLITTIAFSFGFFFFGRSMGRGIAALGRNPLASRTIVLGIITSVIMTILIIGTGLVLAYFVLTL